MDEEALVARAKEEREKIFQRYDKGREPGAEIDPWEDPQFEEYHKMDRYGFIHDERLPQKRDRLEVKATVTELEREKKWLKLLVNPKPPLEQQQPPSKRPPKQTNKRQWNDPAVQAKVRKRVFKGIPEKVRGMVWRKLLKLEEVMERGEGKYMRMLELARQWSTEARQIDKDVNRQFRDHTFYRERYSVKQKSLFNVLVAYSMYNSEVGYCQGMSGLAGVLLMYMDEEEAFWALSVLLADPKFAMHGLFIEGFPKLNRFLAHHDKIITKFLPKLKKHFDRCNLDSILYSLKWFFVVFIERIPFSLCLRVWDIYLLDGEKVVTAMAYNILRMHKARLLKLRDMDQIVQFIQTKLCQDFGYDNDTVIRNLEQCMDDLRKAGLELPPPPPGDAELPKKPFGVFVEPTTAAQIGRRKQEFTETEKDVTETVKLKREITEQEIANLDRIALSAGGSTQQLNAVHIPESEDGGSLLGSSRKSLADTSVTSTADLSVVSGGQSQRSHQPFDFCVDEQKVIPSEDEGEDGESSPVSSRCWPAGEPPATSNGIVGFGDVIATGAATTATAASTARPAKPGSATSAIGSTSVVERSPSALLMTPRAMSPHDVVRIYVPPAPPEELAEQSLAHQPKEGDGGTTSALAARPSTNGVGQYQQAARGDRSARGSAFNADDDEDEEARTRRNSEIDLYPVPFGNGLPADGTMTTYGSGRFSDYASGDFQGQQAVQMSTQPLYAGTNGRSTSSSRRGSMSRKSPAPMLDSEFIIECSHVRNRKYVPDHHSSHSSLVLGNAPGERRSVAGGPAVGSGGSRNGSETDLMHRMTSFEELAKAAKQLHHRSGGTGSTSSLLRNPPEDCYVVRQTVIAQTGTPSRMVRSELYESIDNGQQQDDPGSLEGYEEGPREPRKGVARGHKSDYSIQYRNLSPKAPGPISPQSDGTAGGGGGGGEGGAGSEQWSSGVEYRALKGAPSSRQNSGNDSSPFDYDPLPAGGAPSVAPSKLYNRFFNNDEEDGEEEEEEEEEEEVQAVDSGSSKKQAAAVGYQDDENRLLLGRHSSDDSSTSPPPKPAPAPQGPSAARPSQLPQLHHGSGSGAYGSQQRQQRPRQREPAEHENGGGATPTAELMPLLPASPPGGSVVSLERGRTGSSSKLPHSPPSSYTTSLPRRGTTGTGSELSSPTSPPSSSFIPLSSSSSSSTRRSAGRRRTSNASSTTAADNYAPVSPLTGGHQSRIPVSGGVVKSPTSPPTGGSFRGTTATSGDRRTRIPTTRGEAGPPAISPATYRRTGKRPDTVPADVNERLPPYQYGSTGGIRSPLGPRSTTHHIPQQQQQQHPDANRIRIQVNPSPQSYVGKPGG